jgi:predicted CXXCH cytochrome family protein
MWLEKSFSACLEKPMAKIFSKTPLTFIRIDFRKAAIFMPALLFLVFSVGDARAGWLLNPAEFHASAHGRTACTDCHNNVTDQPLHPNPLNLEEHRKESFHADQCLDCHDDVEDELDKGIHASKKIKNRDKYNNCLQCHRRPHRRPLLGKNRSGAYQARRPVETQCGACHEKMSALPPFSEEDAACMKCHQTRNTDNPKDVQAIAELCFNCHGKGTSQARVTTSKFIPLMDETSYSKTSHKDLACTVCHENATDFRQHRHQKSVNCLKCHFSHIVKDTHDAHLGVTCQTCHLKGIVPIREVAGNRLGWKMKKDLTDLSLLHQMNIKSGEKSCKRCHFSGNDLGAAAMVLPAKSILCMPCHMASFSLNDTISIAAFIIFLCGVILFVSVLLSGTMRQLGSKNPLLKLLQAILNILRTAFSPRIVTILKALFWDALLQRRLYRRSPVRWCIHGLIFYPFVFRFFWGLLALLGSLWEPGNPLVLDMINKNNPLIGFLFDVTGMMMISGVILAYVRGFIEQRSRAAGTPPQDRIALALMGGIVLIGFLLEGMRIVMTGRPAGSGYSFVGYWISFWFSPSRGLPEVYTVIWYIHAVLTGAFIAYIPFSRLLHMILAPLVISINAVSPPHGGHHENNG